MTIGEKMNSCIRNSEKYQLIVTEAYSNPIEKEASSVVVKIFNKYNVVFKKDFVPFDMTKRWRDIYDEVLCALAKNDCMETAEKMESLEERFII